MATANDVMKIAISQLGYKETPSGSNKTKYGKEYGMNGVAWCAEFIWWCFKHANASSLFYGGGKCAYCPTIADYYIAHKQTVSKSSGKYGDIVLFGFGHTNSQHIGFIEKKNSDGSYTCIEGNTSTGNNCNGGMVMRRKRYQSQINWIVRPKYGSATTIKAITKPTGKYNGTIPSNTLQYGSEGTKVKNLQKFLNWYGSFKLTVDGEFGLKTDNALQVFQKTESLEVDGIYGAKSYAKAKTYAGTSATVEKKTEIVEKKSYSGSFPNFVELSGDIIANEAIRLAYPLGTAKSKYTYGKGKATNAFTTAINKVFPKRSTWSKQCQAGASCDIGAATVIRSCGADTSIPRGLEEQFPYMEKSSKWKDMGIKSSKNFKAGDVGMYSNKGNGAHIWINVSGSTIAESNHTAKYFFHLVKKTISNSSSRKKYYCMRYQKAIREYLKQGDTGTQVTRLQNFLTWYGIKLTADGDFGEKTKNAVIQFQKNNGLTADGEFGAKSLTKAKEIKK